jgi:transglutaminase-like putative cysteine protease
MDWARPSAATKPASAASALTLVKRWSGGLLDWETLITLGLLLGAVTAVAAALEDGGWRKNMPPLTTVSVIAVLSGTLLARSRLSAFVAGPLAILTGAAVVGWQTLVMAGPGTPSDRVTNVYDRFSNWFNVVNTNAVTNDPLPFNVLILALTWLGVMLFVWSVFRWQNAWIGLIPGGVALFVDLTLVGDNLTGAIALYMLFGFLLVMQTNLLANIASWRKDAASYPAMINLTFLNFSFWALVLLMSVAWILPAGLSTPGPVNALGEQVIEFGARFVRLAGPLQSSKVIPIHAYGGTLPFQGSIKLGDRELMSVTVTDPRIRTGKEQGQIFLRGTTYSDFESEGWQLGSQTSIPLHQGDRTSLSDQINQQQIHGTLIPMDVQMLAKSVAGTVVYSAGTPVDVDRDLAAQIPSGSVYRISAGLPGTVDMSDDDAITALADRVPDGGIVIGVERDDAHRVTALNIVKLDQFGLLGDTETLDPGERVKRYERYSIVGFVPDYSADELRATADEAYPNWVLNEDLQLPDIPQSIRDKAAAFAGGATNPYDIAINIEKALRENYTIDYNVPETPPGRDTLEYFLNDLHRGYFDYHASAMTVMLRSLGIPARMAVGFAVDSNDLNGDGAYVVKDQNSYAWPEVYFPGKGWVAFNPTPDRAEKTTPTVSDEPPTSIDGLDPGIIRFLPAGSDPIVNLPAGAPGLQEPSATGDGLGGISIGSGSTGMDWVVIATLAFIAALIGVIAVGWQRSVAGLPYPQQVWEKTVRLASWGGNAPAPGQTPHDYARRLSKRFRDVERDFPGLADAYAKSRFGHKEISEGEAKALKEAWPYVRTALVGGIVGRWRRRKDSDHY